MWCILVAVTFFGVNFSANNPRSLYFSAPKNVNPSWKSFWFPLVWLRLWPLSLGVKWAFLVHCNVPCFNRCQITGYSDDDLHGCCLQSAPFECQSTAFIYVMIAFFFKFLLALLIVDDSSFLLVWHYITSTGKTVPFSNLKVNYHLACR